MRTVVRTLPLSRSPRKMANSSDKAERKLAIRTKFESGMVHILWISVLFSKKKIEKQSTVRQIQKVNLSNKGVLTLFSAEYLYGRTAF